MDRTLSLTKFLIRLLVFIGFFQNAQAQNLVPNPDFEVFTSCPEGLGGGGPLLAIPWQSATVGTVDYYNQCSLHPDSDVPINLFGEQDAHSGVAYAGEYFVSAIVDDYREYLMVQLSTPLDPAFSYQVSFYISLADNMCGSANIGMYFSEDAPPGFGTGPLNVTPQVINTMGNIINNHDWTLISGCYVPVGGEEYITIGNFYDDEETPLDPGCDWSGSSYYYIDDVSVIQGDPPGTIPLDLGGLVIECTSYLIDPQVTDVYYHWEDGSTASTLTVTESGTYSLTVTSDCNIGIDSVEVIIEGEDEVQLGPDEVTICEGESYNIFLDADLGEYTWQDGSHDSEYFIMTSGTYQVSLDDGCDITTDQVEVNVLSPPAAFDLGGDANLCVGQQINFTFDPDLGVFQWQDNSNSSDYTITDEGTYSLTISNACGEAWDQIEIAFIEAPLFDLGPLEIVLCNGQSLDFDFDPGMGDFVWQDGNTDYYYSIVSSGLYTLTVTNECGSETDNILVNEVFEPVFDLGPDMTLCSGELPITLDVSNVPNAVTVLWEDGSTNTLYQVTGAGFYSVTISNECFSVDDDIQINIEDDSLFILFPDDQLLCPGDSITLTANNIPGNYLWQDGSTGSEFIVTEAGTYSLSVTNDCGAGADTIVVDFASPLPPPDLGPDVSLCPGEQYIFYANTSGVSYTWQDGSTADSIVVNSAGLYSLQIADVCSTESDTVIVSFDSDPPAIDLPAALSLCIGDTLSIDAGISGVNLLWSDGSQLSSLEIVAAGSYSLTVTNACGTDADTVDVIDAGLSPIVSLGADVSLCESDIVSLVPVSSDVISWLWQDGSTSSTFNISQPGLVIANVSNNCGVDNDTLLVTLLPAVPNINLGADTSLCPGESLTLSLNIPGVDILWSDGSTNNSFTTIDPGVVFATVTNDCGVASDSVIIHQLPPLPLLNLGIDQSLCPGETIHISPGIPGVDYLWQDGSTSSGFNATQAGDIILTISNDCGSDVDTLGIVENTDGPQLNLGPDILACEGELVTLSSDISGVDYLWQDGSTLHDISTDVSGIFILHVSNACGDDVDTVEVDIRGTIPSPSLGNDTSLCEGISLQLISTADDLTSVIWQDGSNEKVFMVNDEGTYILSEANHCGAASDTIMVMYEPAPDAFDLGPDTTLCPGESIILNAPATSSIITWQDGSHNTSITADKQQTYSLTISNECGAEKDELQVSIDLRSPVIDLDPVITLCPEETITLDVTQSFDAVYLWNDNSTLPSIEITTPGVYAVSVYTDCQSIQQAIDVVEDEHCIIKNDIYIPTVFSPNGDNVNDIFTITFGSDIEVKNIECSIFDRWGNQVFHSTSFPVLWDGMFGNNLVNPGVFVYDLRLDYMVNNREIKEALTGDITLIR